MKKRFFMLLSILLIAAMLCSPLFAFAFSETEERETSLLQDGNFEIEYSEKISSFGAVGNYLAQQQIYNGLINVSDSINVYFYRVSVDEVDALLSDVINDNPDLFYVSSSYQITYSGTRVLTIIPYYSMTMDEIEDAKEIFNLGVADALKEVDSSMSNIQKALVIHDYICDRVAYPVLEKAEDDKDIYHSAYGVFYEGNAVCAGYTLAYSYLMHELGIECEYVASSPMQHAWNKVKLGDNWYNIDITYDNYDFNEGLNTVGSIHHMFFLKSDEYFASQDGVCHYGGQTYDSCDASSTDLDEQFWDEVHSRIFVLNGDYYYLKPETENYRVILTARTEEGSEHSIGQYYYSAVYENGVGQYDENGNVVFKYFNDILSRLAFLDGRFYITDSSKLYSQSLNGKKCLIASISNCATGLSVRQNNIVYNIYSSSNDNYLDKLEYFAANISTPKSGYNNYPDINNDGYVNAKDYAIIIKE